MLPKNPKGLNGSIKSDAATAGYAPAEEIAFVYESITITFEDGGITVTDDWVAPGT
jgi:type VI protein secretion system component Hcp